MEGDTLSLREGCRPSVGGVALEIAGSDVVDSKLILEVSLKVDANVVRIYAGNGRSAVFADVGNLACQVVDLADVLIGVEVEDWDDANLFASHNSMRIGFGSAKTDEEVVKLG